MPVFLKPDNVLTTVGIFIKITLFRALYVMAAILLITGLPYTNLVNTSSPFR